MFSVICLLRIHNKHNYESLSVVALFSQFFLSTLRWFLRGGGVDVFLIHVDPEYSTKTDIAETAKRLFAMFDRCTFPRWIFTTLTDEKLLNEMSL